MCVQRIFLVRFCYSTCCVYSSRFSELRTFEPREAKARKTEKKRETSEMCDGLQFEIRLALVYLQTNKNKHFDGWQWKNIDFTPKLSEKQNCRLYHRHRCSAHTLLMKNLFVRNFIFCCFVMMCFIRISGWFMLAVLRANFLANLNSAPHTIRTLKIANQYFIGILAMTEMKNGRFFIFLRSRIPKRTCFVTLIRKICWENEKCLVCVWLHRVVYGFCLPKPAESMLNSNFIFSVSSFASGETITCFTSLIYRRISNCSKQTNKMRRGK